MSNKDINEGLQELWSLRYDDDREMSTKDRIKALTNYLGKVHDDLIEVDEKVVNRMQQMHHNYEDLITELKRQNEVIVHHIRELNRARDRQLIFKFIVIILLFYISYAAS